MNELHYPWIEIAILLPLIGAAWVSRLRDPSQAQRHGLVFSALAALATAAEVRDFYSLKIFHAEDAWHLMSKIFGRELFGIDELSAPLVPMTALIFLLTGIATLRTKLPRFSFPMMLVLESLTLALFSTDVPWVIILFLALTSLPAWMEIRSRQGSAKMFAIFMGASTLLMALGWAFVHNSSHQTPQPLWAVLLVVVGVSIRCGVFPFHLWIANLFENATFGTALLVTTPLAGAYAALRLILPIAPGWMLSSLGMMSMITAVYSSGLCLIQKDTRRLFACLMISHSMLVLIGLEVLTPIGLTGALCVWLAAGMSLGGFGLTLRALEARRGRLRLDHFQGLYEHAPGLAVCFLLTGLACVGFPGTIGFIGTEMLIDGAVEAFPHVGPLLVIAATFNGIAILRAYFLLFTGTQYQSSVSLRMGRRERIAVLTLAALILGGGLFPQRGVSTVYHAAQGLLQTRHGANPHAPAQQSH